MKLIRGYLALIIIFVFLLLCDPVQRLVVAPLAWALPQRRIRIYDRWQKLMAAIVFQSVERVGGVRFSAIPHVPGEPGVLILMNHQSVFDIPIVVRATQGAYPRIVTRKRYLRWIPLISHMIRLYQYPVVDPRANSREMRVSLRAIEEAARTSDVPLAIFPEGTRTKDGEIGRFRPKGLRTILAQRPWEVHVLVADGFWQRAKMKHFVRGMGDIRGRVEKVGVYRWDDPSADPDVFIEEIRDAMVECLARMRRTVTA